MPVSCEWQSLMDRFPFKNKKIHGFFMLGCVVAHDPDTPTGKGSSEHRVYIRKEEQMY